MRRSDPEPDGPSGSRPALRPGERPAQSAAPHGAPPPTGIRRLPPRIDRDRSARKPDWKRTMYPDHDKRLGFIDVGARGGVSPLAAQHSDRLIQVLVEPEASEAERLHSLSDDGRRYRVIGSGLAHVDAELHFQETVNPFCSSILKVNHDVLDQYENLVEHFAFRTSTPVSCSRYDTLYFRDNLPLPHILKIDVQGFEHQVLQGFGGLLQHTLGIVLETHLYPIYQDQKLFGDIIEYLYGYDLVLRRITNDRNADLNGDHQFQRDLVEIDAVFTKTRSWSAKQDQTVRDDLNFVCSLLGVVPNR
ncbi:MAG: FkbM family methyltransferase [Methylobacterium frigidaeris]